MTTFGLQLRDPSMTDVADIARAAERAGLTHLLTTELSLVQERCTGRDPFLVSALALAATSRLVAGTGVVGSPFHAARHLALSAASLTEAYPDRMILGVGVAHRAFAEQIGWPFPSSPLTHMRDYVAELRATRDRIAFGTAFPIWLAALGERMNALAAEQADGVLLNWVSPDGVRATTAARDHASGRQPVTTVLLRVGTGAANLADAERYWRMFTSYRAHFARQGLESPADVARRTCLDLDDGDAARELLGAYAAAGADHVLLYPANNESSEIAGIVEDLGGLVRAVGDSPLHHHHEARR